MLDMWTCLFQLWIASAYAAQCSPKQKIRFNVDKATETAVLFRQIRLCQPNLLAGISRYRLSSQTYTIFQSMIFCSRKDSRLAAKYSLYQKCTMKWFLIHCQLRVEIIENEMSYSLTNTFDSLFTLISMFFVIFRIARHSFIWLIYILLQDTVYFSSAYQIIVIKRQHKPKNKKKTRAFFGNGPFFVVFIVF